MATSIGTNFPAIEKIAAERAGLAPLHTRTNGNGTDHKETVREPVPSAGEMAADFPYTDAGNAEAFAQMYGDRVRWDKRRKRWLLWQAPRWRPDTDGEVERLALECVRTRQQRAVLINDDDKRKRALRWGMESESLYRRTALLKSVSDFYPVVDAGENWDEDSWTLGCQRGIIDLRTGTQREGTTQDRITMSTGIAFDPLAECPRWLQFLDEIFGDEALVHFVQRAVGYCLTGDTSEQVIFLCYGTGANGKSVFLDTLRYALGDYACNTPFSTFELHERSSATNDVAALVGKRLVTSSETREGTQLNEARIKAITDGDPLTARFLHKEFFTFYPRFKVWLAANHKPKVSDNSYGFWRRIRLIPFTRTFGPDKADPRLRDIMRDELPGILTWATLGALAWQNERLEPPDIVTAATKQYQTESDPLVGFISDFCEVNERASVLAVNLVGAYNNWAKRMGEKEMTQTAFGIAMTAHGFERKQERDAHGQNKTFYLGIKLLQ